MALLEQPLDVGKELKGFPVLEYNHSCLSEVSGQENMEKCFQIRTASKIEWRPSVSHGVTLGNLHNVPQGMVVAFESDSEEKLLQRASKFKSDQGNAKLYMKLWESELFKKVKEHRVGILADSHGTKCGCSPAWHQASWVF